MRGNLVSLLLCCPTFVVALFGMLLTASDSDEPGHSGKAGHKCPPPMPPDQALDLLAEGNLDYLKHNSENPPDYERERRELVAGQCPYTIVLSCSDSRVPPEIVFDQTLGKLFVIRVAGNVTDPSGLGSIEYAADHRYSSLLFVMAHEQCGAVKTTMDVVRTGEAPDSPNLMALINSISPFLDPKRLDSDNKEDVAVNVDRNLQGQMTNVVLQSASLAARVRRGELQIIGAIYGLESGEAKPLYYYDWTEQRVRPLPQPRTSGD